MSRLFRNAFEDYMNYPDKLTPEELKEFEEKANEKPSLFDALTSPLGFGGGR